MGIEVLESKSMNQDNSILKVTCVNDRGRVYVGLIELHKTFKKGHCLKGKRCIFTDGQGKRHEKCLKCGRNYQNKKPEIKEEK